MYLGVLNICSFQTEPHPPVPPPPFSAAQTKEVETTDADAGHRAVSTQRDRLQARKDSVDREARTQAAVTQGSPGPEG